MDVKHIENDDFSLNVFSSNTNTNSPVIAAFYNNSAQVGAILFFFLVKKLMFLPLFSVGWGALQ